MVELFNLKQIESELTSKLSQRPALVSGLILINFEAFFKSIYHFKQGVVTNQ